MERKILLVSDSKGLIARGIATKLQGLGIDTVSSSTEPEELKEKSEKADLIILYKENPESAIQQTLYQIKDSCVLTHAGLIVIGSEEGDFEKVRGVIPENYIYECFKRPLQMDRFLDAVENYYAAATKYEKKKSILIVDDDANYLNMINDWLKESYRVSMATSGVQAITWLATNRSDLILLDYEMPITPGPQVLEMIRSQPDTAGIPVMFLTGKGDRESIMKVLALKPAGYLLKTIDKAGLLKTLEDYFRAG